MKRAVITGLGAITPLGNTVPDFWNNIVAGKSGAAPVTRFDVSRFRTHFACEVRDFDPTQWIDKGEVRKTDLYTQYALASTEQAVADSGLDFKQMDPFDSGVIWGSGQGGMTTFEEQVTEFVEGGSVPRFSPFFVPKMIINMAPARISIRFGLRGINYTAVSACATSNTALMDALNYIRLGKAKVIITGGSEAAVTRASFGGFTAMKAMSVRNDDPGAASRPFDKDRDGFVMGEGSGTIVLEEYEHAKARGAHIYAELAGAAMTADAYHLTHPDPDGTSALRGMQLALEDAHLDPSDLDYLNAHATSTPVGDIAEARSIHRLSGGNGRLSVSGTKSMTGHLLGGAGAIEAIICIKAIEKGIVPPTINTTQPDEGIPKGLSIIYGSAIEKDIRVSMSNTFGFGGHNGIVVFRKI